ncbi:MAG: DUF1232 domain-containing protein [Clostridia bacterium]|nr:DUF1232 domain-containing protein [Clostridia bacterium]
MWNKLKLWAKALKRDLWLLYCAFKDSQTPFYKKVFIGLILIYALSPMDLIPDFIPVLGYLDDLLLLPIFIWLVKKMISTNQLERYENLQREPIKKHWYYGLLIVAIWLFIIKIIWF